MWVMMLTGNKIGNRELEVKKRVQIRGNTAWMPFSSDAHKADVMSSATEIVNNLKLETGDNTITLVNLYKR